MRGGEQKYFPPKIKETAIPRPPLHRFYLSANKVLLFSITHTRILLTLISFDVDDHDGAIYRHYRRN